MGPVLTTLSSVQCPHGGRAVLTTSNATTHAAANMLLESDTHTVVGCGFFAGNTYSPCLTIMWQAGATALSVGGTPVLVKSSVGTCKNAGGLVQGVALVASTQLPVSAK